MQVQPCRSMCRQNGRVRAHGCYTFLFAKAKRCVLRSLHEIGAGDADGSCDRDRVNSRLTSVGNRGRRQPSAAIGVRYNMEFLRSRNKQQHQPRTAKPIATTPAPVAVAKLSSSLAQGTNESRHRSSLRRVWATVSVPELEVQLL